MVLLNNTNYVGISITTIVVIYIYIYYRVFTLSIYRLIVNTIITIGYYIYSTRQSKMRSKIYLTFYRLGSYNY